MTLRDFPKVTIDSLLSWDKEEYEEDDPLSPDVEDAVFSINKELNDKIYFWKGHILSIAVDAIVNTTNETLNDKTGVCGDIFINGGQMLVNEVSRLDGCRTGEAKISRSHSLPHNRHVIHTVGPRYNLKYETAAENALHSCYRNSLQLCIENKLKSIALPPINTPLRGYPRDLAAHLSLITIRKFLDKYGQELNAIVFVFDNKEDFNLYNTFAKYYFPRTKIDQSEAKIKLPVGFNNTSEFGEKIIPEREIRIAPIVSSPSLPDENINLISNLNSNDDLSISALNSLEEHPDEIRRIENSKKNAKQIEEEEIERIYQNYLRNTKNEDLTEITRLNIVINQNKITKGDQSSTLHLISNNDFVVVYLHAGMSKKQQPDFAWIQLLYKIWERKFTQRMANLYIVHPSFWVKFILTLMKPFVSQVFTNRMIFVNSLSILFNSIPSTIRIPDPVYTYDQKENGNNAIENPKNEGL